MEIFLLFSFLVTAAAVDVAIVAIFTSSFSCSNLW